MRRFDRKSAAVGSGGSLSRRRSDAGSQSPKQVQGTVKSAIVITDPSVRSSALILNTDRVIYRDDLTGEKIISPYKNST